MGKEKGEMEKQRMKDTNTNKTQIIDFSATLSVIPLNVNGLNTSYKRYSFID